MKNRQQRRQERRQQKKARAAEMRSPLHHASALFQSGKAGQAGDILEKFLGDQPENFDALTLLGVVRATSGDPGAAIPLFENAARIRPGDAGIHINLAKACEEQGRFDDAIGHYRRSLEIEPNNDAYLINLGNLLKDTNDITGATACYQRALEINPENAGVHSNLGNVLEAQGRLDESVASHRRALEIDPENAMLHSNLGIALKAQGLFDDAVGSHKRALEIDPAIASIHNNLGYALEAQGSLDDAVASYREALAIQPDYAEAHNNLGNVLMELVQLDEARASYQKAVTINPDYAEALSNLGVAFKELRKLDEAVTSHQQALAINPDYAEAHSNLGVAFKEFGKLDEAVSSYQKALAINPDYAGAHNNLGNALIELGQLDEAMVSCQKALSINPEFAEAWNNLGITFKDMGRMEDAVASCNKSLAIKPDLAEAHINLGNSLIALLRQDEAVDCFRKALALKPDYTDAGRNLLFALLDVPGLTPKELFAEHVRFAENHARDIVRLAGGLTNDTDPDRRLRVGYLSSDFRNHPVGRNVFPLISSHDYSKFEIFCYADVLRPDAMTEQLRSFTDHWRPITGKSDSDVAKMVRTDGIDILVSLAGHFDRNRPLVSVHRAAPVQVSFHDGATSGLEEMDYWLTDGLLHPPDTQELFTEELYRLPVLYQYPPIEDAPPVGALSADQAGYITFGSFNNPAKINDEVIGLWAEVLNAVPGSKVMFKYKNWYAQESLRESLSERFAAGGIGQDRIIFSATLDSFAEHLGSYGEVDIALDPFPFNGATTTFQALWMGVPVVSLVGNTFISRAAGSLLHQTGLGDLAVDTPEAYVACARGLAGDIERLKKLRAELRGRVAASPLCDAPAYASSVEDAYRNMWRTWCGFVDR